MQSLEVAETFYSIQGEGPSAGIPSVFLRLSGCTLKCAWCDTETVWNRPGIRYTTSELVSYFEDKGFLTHLYNGAHLILTGGSPLKQQDGLIEFVETLRGDLSFKVEIETEGVLLPSKELDVFVFLYNVSPKLSNSEMPILARRKVDVLRFHALDSDSIFKFVIARPNDIQEVCEMVNEVGIHPGNVYLMPCAQTAERHRELAPEVVEMCKQHHFNFSPRLQVVIYDQVTGV